MVVDLGEPFPPLKLSLSLTSLTIFPGFPWLLLSPLPTLLYILCLKFWCSGLSLLLFLLQLTLPGISQPSTKLMLVQTSFLSLRFIKQIAHWQSPLGSLISKVDLFISPVPHMFLIQWSPKFPTPWLASLATQLSQPQYWLSFQTIPSSLPSHSIGHHILSNPPPKYIWRSLWLSSATSPLSPNQKPVLIQSSVFRADIPKLQLLWSMSLELFPSVRKVSCQSSSKVCVLNHWPWCGG